MKQRNPYQLLLIFLILLIVVLIFSKLMNFQKTAAFISGLTIFYTGVLPFIYLTLWISKSKIGGEIKKNAKKWHVVIFTSWVIFLYSIYAEMWVANTLNEIFSVNANHLSITYKLLAFLFTPFNLFYHLSILSLIKSILGIVFIMLLIFSPIIIIFVFIPNVRIRELLKVIMKMCFFVFISSFIISIITSISLNKDYLIKEFALWADFSSNNLCTDEWVNKTESVLFLDGGYVLAYHPQNLKDNQFTVETCNYKKSF
ncbi:MULTISPECIES: hypothetical protein [unclassified Providencia]|uniref:hypothetical protein n=1 Tax=unclassified Providencia TaxID=2633465 RepID=UPI0013DF4493|nr:MULTISPECIES: hypothetical protein [unclassified Providencia]EJD6474339.1 hypothetical protein [Providencia rettgeri]ELU1435840.1 hypothetical protein [Providencia rettgeri]QIF58000.1 hypothetical protein FVA69_11295 [Providencia sp. 1701011]QIF62037.1 hypothetical protein FVA70_11305 [Providencia sp. 1701091]